MSNDKNPVINSVEELLAHALALETDAADHYDEVGENLDFHNNPEVGALFKQLAGYGRKHAAEMREIAKGKNLPHIAPWDFKWPDLASPESIPEGAVHYLMTPHHALSLAQTVEKKAHDFYQGVADATSDAEVKKLAAEFAAEEQEHVDLLDDWLARYPEPEDDWDYDPDPPVMNE